MKNALTELEPKGYTAKPQKEDGYSLSPLARLN